MKIEIVPCKEEYIDAVVDISHTSWQPIFAHYLETLGEKMFNDLHGDWKETKRRSVTNGMKSGRGFVALVDGQVAGFIWYGIVPERKIGYIQDNAVNPKFRGLGIAPKMYDFVLNKMREEGMLYAGVTTGLDDAHAPARRAYEKVGFGSPIESVRYHIEL
jgi:ribosomal protein S18 acetylase RimI-like enzyme